MEFIKPEFNNRFTELKKELAENLFIYYRDLFPETINEFRECKTDFTFAAEIGHWSIYLHLESKKKVFSFIYDFDIDSIEFRYIDIESKFNNTIELNRSYSFKHNDILLAEYVRPILFTNEKKKSKRWKGNNNG